MSHSKKLLKNKTVLLRVDLNSEISKGKPVISDRMIEHSKTISLLKKKKAKIVVLAHQGNPGRDFTSLKGHAKLLNKYTKVQFIQDIIGKKAQKAIKSLNPGEALLLENVRFLKEEYKPSKNSKLVKILSKLCDYYINDALSISHRAQTSIVSLPKVLPSAMGPVLENELKHIKKVKKSTLFILAGAKPKDVILLAKNSKVLVAGYLGQLTLMSRGNKLNQEKYLKKSLKLLPKIKKLKHLITPVDYAIESNGKRKELPLKNFPNKEIMDIGSKTIKLFIKEIKKARSIFLKGPVGYCEDPKFCKGTKAILKTIEKSKVPTVIAGGHINTSINKFKINKKKLGYVSLSGGALVRYITGENLPGLEALKKK